MTHNDFLCRAIALSRRSLETGGGPFGAVVVRDGVVLGEGSNGVVTGHDPTAHAEVVAIRAACMRLGTHDLTGAELYTSCEPCPMCLGAIWWARISAVHFGNDRRDAAAIGFDDEAIYQEIGRPLPERHIPMIRRLQGEAASVFAAWAAKSDRIMY